MRLAKAAVRSRAPRHSSKPRLLAVEALEARALLTLSGNQLFPADNPWNESVAAAPVAANSATLVASIGAVDALSPRLWHRLPRRQHRHSLQHRLRHAAEDSRRARCLCRRERSAAGAHSQRRRHRGRSAAQRPEHGRPPPDRLRPGQQRCLRVVQRAPTLGRVRWPVACRLGSRLEHEHRLVPHARVHFGRRRWPADPARVGPARRGARSGRHHACPAVHRAALRR